MMKKLMIAGLLLGFSGTSLAAENAPNLEYGYAQFAYSNITLNAFGEEIDFDGPSLAGSFEVGQNSFFQVGYSTLSGEAYGTDIDGTDMTLGLGGAWSISPRSDFVASVSYIDSEVDVAGFMSEDDSGFGLNFGVRSLLTQSFELFGSINYVNYDESDTGFTGGARFIANESFSILAAYQTADDVDGFSVGARFEF